MPSSIRFLRRCWREKRRRLPIPRTHPPYRTEYRRRIIELARSGRPIAQLAREFEASANAIRKWVKQTGLDEGLRSDGLTTAERPRSSTGCGVRTGCCVKSARYCQKPRPGSRRRPARCRHGVPIRERESGHVRGCHDVPGAGSLRQWLLCVAQRPPSARAARRRGLISRITRFTISREPMARAVHGGTISAGIQVDVSGSHA